MSARSLKAVDLYCRVMNEDDQLQHAYPEELPRWTRERDRVLKKFRTVMAKVTKEEFLSGRWSNTPMQERLAQWDAMVGRAGNPN